MSQTIDINPQLTAKQKEALKYLFTYDNQVTEVLYGGAAGGGKSFLGCLFIIISALKYPETRWLIGRSKLNILKTTTLKTFFEVCKILNLKQDEHFNFNQQSNQIKFFNGSEIILKDLFTYPSDPEFDSLGSLEIAGAFIDECNQVSEKAKNIVMSRIRHKLDEFNISPKIFLSCNPTRNWVYNEFYKKHIDGKLEEHKIFIPALADDNKFLTKHYVKNLEKLDEVSKRRLLHGVWDYQDILSIFNYDAIIEMFEIPEQESDNQIFLTVDVARLGRDKTCIIVWRGLHIVEIIEYSKLKLDEQKEKIELIKTKYGINNKDIIIDSDGVGGGLADMLKGSISIVNNAKAINGENYQNLKTQLYYKLAEQINSGKITINEFIQDNIKLRLTQELQIIKRENADMDGKLQITSKDKIKQQIGRSPDISDALAFRMIKLIKKTNGGDFSFTVLNF
jgi:phage terminase large subunit